MPVQISEIEVAQDVRLVVERHCTMISFVLPTPDEVSQIKAVGQFHKLTKLPDGTVIKREFDGVASLTQAEIEQFEYFVATYQFLSTNFHAKRAEQDEPQP